MSKIAVLVDSTSYMTEELRQNENLEIVYLSTTINGSTRKELVDITLDEYATYLSGDSDNFPTTSQPAIGEVVLALEKLKNKGYTDVIAIALSSGISGTFSSYSVANLMVEGINVHSFDSEVSCQAETFYVIKALELIKEGLEPEKILQKLEEMKLKSRAYFVVDDLAHLQRGGRLSGAAALVGSLLQVKPILHFDNKVIVPFQKIRTHKKAIARIYELFDEFYNENSEANIHVCVIGVKAEDKLDEMEEYIRANYSNVTIHRGEIGPVIATHLGLGAVALGWTII